MLVQNLNRNSRRGIALPFMALMIVLLLGMVAFAVDIGMIALTRVELQAAADAASHAGAIELYMGEAAARAEAKRVAALNFSGGEPVILEDEDIVFGYWNDETQTFTEGGTPSNSLRVIAQRDDVALSFGAVLGKSSQDIHASSTSAISPRDIAFVIDLSGSMNNDTEIWATDAINNEFPEYPGIGTELMQNVFDDFGYGTYPGTTQHIGEGLVASDWYSYENLTANGGPLTTLTIPVQYRISSSDDEATRKTKAYSWIIDNQLATLMPDADPAPNSSSSYTYYERFLDYMILPIEDETRGVLPPNQHSFRLYLGGNPYTPSWPGMDFNDLVPYFNKLGYQTYVQFMMDHGWNRDVTGSTKVPLSRLSPNVPTYIDNIPGSPGYGFSFPPREQPTHAMRLSVMGAVDKLDELNMGVPESVKDHISIITFDSSVDVLYPLNISQCDYYSVKDAATQMQAAADDSSNTAAELALLTARQHLDPALNPGGARPMATKIIVFLSDGVPNLKQSSNAEIDNYMSENGGEWFTSGSSRYFRNAAMMQAALITADGSKVYSVGVGLGADRQLMDRIARIAGTGMEDPGNPTGPEISAYAGGNPADYQDRVSEIFSDILGSRNLHIVR